MSNKTKVPAWIRRPFQPINTGEKYYKITSQNLNDRKRGRVLDSKSTAVHLQRKGYGLWDYENKNIPTPYYAIKEESDTGCITEYACPPTMLTCNLFSDKENPKKIIWPKLSRNDGDKQKYLELFENFIKKLIKSKKANSEFSLIALNCYMTITIEFLCNFDIMYKSKGKNNKHKIPLNDDDLLILRIHTNGSDMEQINVKYSSVKKIREKTYKFLEKELPSIILERLNEIDLEIKSTDPDTKKQLLSYRNRELLRRIETGLSENKSFKEILKFFFSDNSYEFDLFIDTLLRYFTRDEREKNSIIKSAKVNAKLLKEMIEIYV